MTQARLERVLSGMRPTGNLHIGNYFGAIRQFIELQEAGHECFFFAADLHALTEVRQGGVTDLAQGSAEVVKNYLACGIDPSRSVLYRQSDVPQIAQLADLLTNVVSIGELRRCTTFKDKTRLPPPKNESVEDRERREQREAERENQLSVGLLRYPVLMAADMFVVRGERIPVGEDQVQHVEMARNFAEGFNRLTGQAVITVPRLNALELIRVPGIDGAAKMGKTDGNTIALLENLRQLERKIKRIPTETTPSPIPEPKENDGFWNARERMYSVMQPGTSALYRISELCMPAETFQGFCEEYENGAVQFGRMKARLVDDLTALLEGIQTRYRAIKGEEVQDVLQQGATRAREIGAEVLQHAYEAIGLTQKGT